MLEAGCSIVMVLRGVSRLPLPRAIITLPAPACHANFLPEKMVPVRCPNLLEEHALSRGVHSILLAALSLACSCAATLLVACLAIYLNP